MNIYVQISQCLEDLSANERKLAEYLLAQPDSVLQMTADRLASELYISKSAVYRFCDKLKLAGYGELKRRLASDMSDYLLDQGLIIFQEAVFIIHPGHAVCELFRDGL